MKKEYEDALFELKSRKNDMLNLVWRWSEINSGTRNITGLNKMKRELKSEFHLLGFPIEEIKLQQDKENPIPEQLVKFRLGSALSIKKETGGRSKIFLGIHYDTVYGRDHPFQKVSQLDQNRIQGPGVTDAKGGIVILLYILRIFEQTSMAKGLNWEVFLNPDEEIGSPGSSSFFKDAARRNDLGLIFEPCYPDGRLISARGGSGFFILDVRGKSAHVGRDFQKGRNAFHLLAKIITELERFCNEKGYLFNTGKIEGGGPVNVVQDHAICYFNLRIPEISKPDQVLNQIRALIQLYNKNGFGASLFGNFQSPPKPFTKPNKALFSHIKSSANELNLDLKWKSSSGVCDGNKLQHFGLPVIDTLGAQGANLHSSKEYLLVDSLVQRAQVSLLFLMKLASNEIKWPNSEIMAENP